MHGAEKTYEGRVNFVYLDIDNPDNKQYIEALPYRGQPTIIILGPQGDVLQTHYGFINEEQITALLDTALAGQ